MRRLPPSDASDVTDSSDRRSTADEAAPPAPGPASAAGGTRTAGSDRAISDVVSFVLSFSMIVIAVGAVYTAGFTSLNELSQDQQQQSALRSFESYATSLNEVQGGETVRRAGEIGTGDGQLRVVYDSRVNVEGDDKWTTGWRSLGAFQFFLDRTNISYESGAVFRSDRGNAVTRDPPSMTCRSDYALVSLVTVQSRSAGADSSGTVSVVSVRNRTRLLFPENRTGDNASTNEVTVTIDSPRAEAWARTMTERGWTATQVTPTTYEFECDPVDGPVYVRWSLVTVTVET